MKKKDIRHHYKWNGLGINQTAQLKQNRQKRKNICFITVTLYWMWHRHKLTNVPGGPKKRYLCFNFAITSANTHRF